MPNTLVMKFSVRTSQPLKILTDDCKISKYSDKKTSCCNYPKIQTVWLYHRVMLPKDADGMANSVDPYQTAPSLIWIYIVYSGISVRKLRIITVCLPCSCKNIILSRRTRVSTTGARDKRNV